MREEVCPECEGSGYVEAAGPDYYSEAFGNYLPTTTYKPCPVCRGAGTIEVPEVAYADLNTPAA